MPALSRSRQDYLRTLYALAPEGEVVATSDFARRLPADACRDAAWCRSLELRRAVARSCTIRDADAVRLAHWKRVGLVPGAVVRVRDVRSLEDVMGWRWGAVAWSPAARVSKA